MYNISSNTINNVSSFTDTEYYSLNRNETPIGSFIWMLSHQGMALIGRVGDVALLEVVCNSPQAWPSVCLFLMPEYLGSETISPAPGLSACLHADNRLNLWNCKRASINWFILWVLVAMVSLHSNRILATLLRLQKCRLSIKGSSSKR